MRLSDEFECRVLCRVFVVKYVVEMSCLLCYNGYSEKYVKEELPNRFYFAASSFSCKKGAENEYS